MTEEDLKQFLADNAEDIRVAVKAKTIEAMTSNLGWQLRSELVKVVEDFITTEIVPEVKAHLLAQKGVLIAAACAGAAGIGDEIAKNLVGRAAKNLDGYRGGQVLKALFE